MALIRPKASQINTIVTTIQDPLTVLNQGSALANVDVGFIINRDGGTSANTAIFWDESANTFVTAFTTSSGTTNANVTISEYANIKASTLFGNIGGGSVLANIYVTGSLLPTANITYDLGSPTHRWREGWFSGNTIHIGDESISVDNTGKWTFTSAGAAVEMGKTTEFNPPNADISGNVKASEFLWSNGVSIITTLSSATSTANTAMKGYVDGEISSVTSAWQSNAAVQAGDIATLYANAAYQASLISSLGDPSAIIANVSALQSNVSTLFANAGAQSGELATLTSNAAVQAGELATLTSNAASQAGEIASLWANAGAQSGELATLTSNAAVQAGEIANLWANAGAQSGALATLTSNAASQSGALATLTSDKANLSGAEFTGNISTTGTITVGNGSSTGVIKSNSTYDLKLTTYSGTTNSPSITLTQDDNGNITLVPSGTGLVKLTKDTLIGNGSQSANISSNGAYDLRLSTGLNMGHATITLRSGSNANVDVSLNGAGTFNVPQITFGDGTTQDTAAGLAGNDGEVQYNNNGVIGASSNFTFNDATNTLTVGGNLTVSGNLSVTGNTTTFSSNNVTIQDAMVYVAESNSGNVLDVGLVGSFTDAVRYQHSGFVRDASDGVWKLFANVVPEPTTTIDFTNAVYSDMRAGNVTLKGLTVSGAAVDLNSSSTDFNLGLKVGRYITGQSGSKLSITNGSNGLYFEAGSNSILDMAGTTVQFGQSTGTGTFTVQMAVTDIQGTQAASSTTTGALRVAGGAGIAGNLYAGAVTSDRLNVTGNVEYGTSYYISQQYIAWGATSTATETEIFLNGVSNLRIPVETNTTMLYELDIVARRTDATGESASWHIKGCVDNFSGTVADVGDIYEIIVARDDATWVVDVRADDTNNSVGIYVTGAAGKTIRWTAVIKTIEVSQ